MMRRSIVVHTEPRMRTITSIAENYSIFEHQDPGTQPSNDFQNIYAWVNKLPFILEEEPKSQKGVCLCVHLSLLSNVALKQLTKRSRFYVRYFCALYSLSEQYRTYVSEPLRLSETKGVRETETGIRIYFHLKEDEVDRLWLRVRCVAYESMEELIFNEIPLGGVNVSLEGKKQVKNYKLDPEFQDSLASEAISSQSGTTLALSIERSDQISLIRSLLPSKCICGSTDYIAGLQGGKLPDDSVPLLYSSTSSSIKISIKNFRFPPDWISKTQASVQLQMKACYSQLTGAEIRIVQTRIHAYCHNGWTVISQASAVQNEDLVRSKMRSRKNKKQSMLSDTIEDSSGDISLSLPLVFQVQECVLLIAIRVKVDCQLDFGKNEKRSIILVVPVCFCVKPLRQAPNDKPLAAHMGLGDCFNLAHLLAYVSKLQRVPQSKSLRQVTNQSFNETESMRPLDRTEQPMLHFELYLQQLMEEKHQKDTIMSNKSVVKEQRKAQLKESEVELLLQEKERLIRMKRAAKEQKKKLLHEINQEISFLDPTELKSRLFEQQIQGIKAEKQQKQQILDYFKSKLLEMEEAEMMAMQLKGDAEEAGLYARSLLPKSQLNRSFLNAVPISHALPVQNESQLLKLPACVRKWGIQTKQLVRDCITPNKCLKVTILGGNLFGLQKQLICFQIFLSLESFESKLFQLTRPATCAVNIKPSKRQAQMKRTAQEERLRNQSLMIPIDSELRALCFSKMSGNILSLLFRDQHQTIIGQSFTSLSHFLQSPQLSPPLIREDLLIYQGIQTVGDISVSFQLNQLTEPSEGKKPIQAQVIQFQAAQYRQMKRIEQFKANKIGEAVPEKKDAIKLVSSVLDSYRKVHHINGYIKKEEWLAIQFSNKAAVRRIFIATLADQDLQYYSDGTTQELMLYPHSSLPTSQNVTLGQRGEFVMEGNSTATFSLRYLTQRHCLPHEYSLCNINHLLKHYNRPHTITLSILEDETKLIMQIHQIVVTPQPQPNTLCFEHYSPAKKEDMVVLPISHRNIIINEEECSQNDDQLIKLEIPGLERRELQLTTLSIRRQKSPLDAPLRLHFILWGAKTTHVKSRFWERVSVLLEVDISNQKDLTLVSKSSSINFRSQEGTVSRIKIRAKEVYAKVEVEGRTLGRSYHKIDVIDGSEIVDRYVLINEVYLPASRQIIRVNLDRQFQEDILREPFQFTNSTSSTKQYFIHTSHPWLLSSETKNLTVPAGRSQQIPLLINVSRIVAFQEREELIMGLRCELQIEYFCFIFLLPK